MYSCIRLYTYGRRMGCARITSSNGQAEQPRYDIRGLLRTGCVICHVSHERLTLFESNNHHTPLTYRFGCVRILTEIGVK